MGRRKDVVLVGGGHSHVQVLRAQLMEPLPDARITVVVDRPVAMYSGMVPGYVAGQYARHELEIDVRPLARKVGARVVVARVTGVDPDARRVQVEGRAPIAYDVASLNVGSTVAGLDTPGVREHALPTRPITDFVWRLPERLDATGPQDGEWPVVVVGAGAGGVELAFTVQVRLRDLGYTPRVTLVGDERPLPGRPERLARRVLADMQARGIAFRSGRVAEVRATEVVLEGGEVLPAGATLWVPGAAGPPFLADTGLPVDRRGFVRVRGTLQVAGHDDLYAVGDCAVPDTWPEIPKAGVYAVRQGPVLARNLRRHLRGEALEVYRPQGDFFTILNYGDGTAIGAKWGLYGVGGWMFRWKDRIDKKFMDKFQVLGPDGAPAAPFTRGLGEMPEMEMVCGGCAAKVGQSALDRALSRLGPQPDAPEVTVGLAEADDVAAVAHGADLVVQSVDAFTGFVDDPWLVGRVAAVNALNDLYAKGVRPHHVLAVVGIPEEDADPEEALFQVLSGARGVLDAHGVRLVGGHTNLCRELCVGFSVTGWAERVPWLVRGARPGDVVVLTRALGTGVLFHEDMAGRAPGPWVEEALRRMTRSLATTAEVAARFEVHAATDVSGFGLAGHLGEMLRKSEVAADLDLGAVPVLPGIPGLLEAGRRSTFHDQNREALRAMRVEPSAQGSLLEVLFDPQTAGGLLLCVPPEAAGDLVAALWEAGEVDAAVVAEVVPPREALITVRA